MDDDGLLSCLKQHPSEKDVVDQLYENDPVVREVVHIFKILPFVPAI